ncbi:hypothetical protein H8356DRAFT_1350440 [Neocallimastix lanati (nom. inval.)]|nr:hypothetical protein H8356DRAFT_1350440 [Neocallimastix sp. JGI-2020a]
MKLILVFILVVLVDSEYFELNHPLKKLYIFSDDECVNFYICEEHSNKCYSSNYSFTEEFNVKEYTDINLTECDISSKGSDYVIY